VPFFTPSPHLGAAHVAGAPLHTPLAQSSATLHGLPSAHGAPPPVATAVRRPSI